MKNQDWSGSLSLAIAFAVTSAVVYTVMCYQDKWDLELFAWVNAGMSALFALSSFWKYRREVRMRKGER